MCRTGVSFSLHGSKPRRRSPRTHKVRLWPSGYQAADGTLAFPSGTKADIMGESSIEALDSSTQEDGLPLGETQQHPCLSTYFNYSVEILGAHAQKMLLRGRADLLITSCFDPIHVEMSLENRVGCWMVFCFLYKALSDCRNTCFNCWNQVLNLVPG